MQALLSQLGVNVLESSVEYRSDSPIGKKRRAASYERKELFVMNRF